MRQQTSLPCPASWVYMMNARRRLVHLLTSAYVHHQQWQQVQERALSQLQSMSNLAEQLSSLRRCSDSGRLSSYPQLTILLEGKILSSFERALGYAHKASETLGELCKQLKSHWKEAERLLSDITALQAEEMILTRTHESFSLCDITEWLRLLNAAHVRDWTEKNAALCHASCTPASMEQVLGIWQKCPDEITGVLECVRYTVSHVNEGRDSQ